MWLCPLLVISMLCGVLGSGLNEDFTWTRINYTWPTQTRGGFFTENSDFLYPGETKPSKTQNKIPSSIDYQYENNIPMGANVWKKKLFITVPRRRLGVPSTLNYIDIQGKQKHNVPLTPYPDWKTNLYPAQDYDNNFVSVYRVAVDACDRLWFVDTGLLELPGNATRIKPVTLYVMDLKTDKIIHRHVFPQSSLNSPTNLASVTVDTNPKQCAEAHAYIPDLAGYALIVFSLKKNRSWKVQHNFFNFEPTHGTFHISGHDFQWNDGIFSVELTEKKADGHRDLYFHAMAGVNMYKVSTKILKDEQLATRTYHNEDFQLVGRREDNSQTSSADIHKDSGVMFMGLVQQNALGCWNVGRSLKDVSIVKRDDAKMIYPCDVKVYKDRVYLLTNTMPEFLYGRLNYDQVNFRVWSNSVRDAILNTNCVEKSGGGYYG